MEDGLNRPKSFGEILDLAFTLCKRYFASFFLIVLLVIGPVYLLEAIFLMLTGTDFFRETVGGGGWLEQTLNNMDAAANTNEDPATMITGLLMVIAGPIAQAAILLVVARLKNAETFTVGDVVKKAFSKFWLILGGSLLLAIMAFAMIFIPMIVVIILGVIGMMTAPLSGFIITLILFLAVSLATAYFLSRWAFYLGSAVFQNKIPGLGRSWHLTRRNSWKVFGIFIVFWLIFLIVSVAFEVVFMMLLGSSVLYTIIVNLVTLLTTTIFMVGYAVIYFDLTIRRDGSDLQAMIDDYEHTNNTT